MSCYSSGFPCLTLFLIYTLLPKLQNLQLVLGVELLFWRNFISDIFSAPHTIMQYLAEVEVGLAHSPTSTIALRNNQAKESVPILLRSGQLTREKPADFVLLR